MEKKRYQQPSVSVLEMRTLLPLQTSGKEILPMDPDDPGTGEVLSKKQGSGKFWDDEERE